MSRGGSSTPYLLATGLIVVIFFGVKLFLDYEPIVKLGLISANVEECSISPSNRGGAGRSNTCKVKLGNGETVSVVWIGQVPRDYTGTVELQKIKAKYTGRVKYIFE